MGVSRGIALEGELPNNNALVARARNESIGGVGSDSEGGDPAVVALKGSAKLQSLDAHAWTGCVWLKEKFSSATYPRSWATI